tara:strand:+ start:99 stop:236 length:138 start_codon:yes stop_codon:yes gene_type:complete
MIAWSVFLGMDLLDTVFFVPGTSHDEVKESCIRDGFNSGISVVKE